MTERIEDYLALKEENRKLWEQIARLTPKPKKPFKWPRWVVPILISIFLISSCSGAMYGLVQLTDTSLGACYTIIEKDLYKEGYREIWAKDRYQYFIQKNHYGKYNSHSEVFGPLENNDFAFGWTLLKAYSADGSINLCSMD